MGTPSSQWAHRLTEKNEETMRGVCATCGPVDLARKGNGVRCSIGRKEQTHGPSEVRKFRYKHATGAIYITPEERAELFEASKKRCHICSKHLTAKTAKYDHCHDTGIFRGWLCNGCNSGIGALGDTLERLESAVKYLKEVYEGARMKQIMYLCDTCKHARTEKVCSECGVETRECGWMEIPLTQHSDKAGIE